MLAGTRAFRAFVVNSINVLKGIFNNFDGNFASRGINSIGNCHKSDSAAN